ncbi:uncharacterized protein LOC129913488 [Episyrphus balteatus]|uniref:uncharacterized protein LOC129913488 n=1 Tax=Episyrphus balteatus TaxID=286459 RepID=UPI0024860052|nr:uncharacterized protein LOC129913488 [Episyrphus balteatus]
MKLIIVTSAFLAFFCCFSQIEFTLAKPTYGYGLGGLPVSALQGLPIASLLPLLSGGGGLGGLLGGTSGPSYQSNTENIAVEGAFNSISKGIDLTGNLNALSGGLL